VVRFGLFLGAAADPGERQYNDRKTENEGPGMAMF
jgi:hypothetical protein